MEMLKHVKTAFFTVQLGPAMRMRSPHLNVKKNYKSVCDDELRGSLGDTGASLEASSGPAVLMLTETREGRAGPVQARLSSPCRATLTLHNAQ